MFVAAKKLEYAEILCEVLPMVKFQLTRELLESFGSA